MFDAPILKVRPVLVGDEGIEMARDWAKARSPFVKICQAFTSESLEM